ncbi:LysR substrate-binding domain-containing protein, partial [Streptomyces brasiliscabiei]|uniref:LysR substrate-binding domain-containing protein n=1 Tax=Streptomyces brasiliscabiei TaxID=2736302 RepID=UPI003014FC4C
GLSFDCDFTGTANVAPRLLAGEADVGLSFQSSTDPRIRDVISVPLPFGVIVPPNHIFSGQKSVRLSDFENQSVILPDHAISYRMIIDRMIEG